MTSPSSYLFYNERTDLRPLPNLNVSNLEDVVVTKVEKTDDELKIQQYAVETSTSGELIEKPKEVWVFSLHYNSHGDKYLRCSGSLSNMLVDSGDFYTNFRFKLGEECIDIIDYTLWSWFHNEGDKKWDKKFARKNTGYLFYPVLKDFPENRHEIKLALHKASTLHGLKNIDEVLCSAHDFRDFISKLSRIDAEKDKDLLDQLVMLVKEQSRLIDFLVLHHGVEHVRYAVEDTERAVKMAGNLSFFDYSCIHYLFSVVSGTQRTELLNLLLTITDTYIANRPVAFFSPMSDMHAVVSRSESEYNSSPDFSKDMQKIPGIVPHLVESLKEFAARFVADARGLSNQSVLPTGLAFAFYRKYSEEVLCPSLASDCSEEKVRRAIEQSFGEYKESFGFDFIHTTSGVTVCALKPEGTLQAMITKASPPKDYDFLKMNFRIEIWDENDNRRTTDNIYPLDDVMLRVRKTVQHIDEQLSQIGREISPENRLAYVTLEEYVHEVTAWEYYWAGLTEKHRIHAALVCGIQPKNITAYASLPDEMFYELIQLHSGVQIPFQQTESKGQWSWFV